MDDETRRAFYEESRHDLHRMRPWIYGFLAFFSVVVVFTSRNPIFDLLVVVGIWIAIGFLLKHAASILNRMLMMVGYFRTIHAFHRDLERGANKRQLAYTPDAKIAGTSAISSTDAEKFEEIMRSNDLNF